jgi:hypothetical protein
MDRKAEEHSNLMVLAGLGAPRSEAEKPAVVYKFEKNGQGCELVLEDEERDHSRYDYSDEL